MATDEDVSLGLDADEYLTVEERLDNIESVLEEIREHSDGGGGGGGGIADLAAIVWSILGGIWLYRHW